VADTLASGFRAHVEVFDTGEEPARGDVETVGEYGYAQYPVLRPGGQYLYVSGLDGLSQAAGEIRWHGSPSLRASSRRFRGSARPVAGVTSTGLNAR
jgi:hypothetical protein